MPGAFHRARPAAGRHEAVGPSSKRLRHTGHHAVAGANKPRTPPVPVQNSPCASKIAPFGAFCSCWESFVPLLSPTSQAWRIFSRTNPNTNTGLKETTPQHNTPSRAVKHLPPQHHTQTHAVKHLPPQHATNNPKSPIFTTQGRTFFHNTHHPHNTHTRANFLSTTGVKTKPTNSRMQFHTAPPHHNRIIRRIPVIRPHSIKHR